MVHVRFGSLAALQDNISLMSASEGKAVVQITGHTGFWLRLRVSPHGTQIIVKEVPLVAAEYC